MNKERGGKKLYIRDIKAYSSFPGGLRSFLHPVTSMGRVRQTYIKRLARNLVDSDPERFSDDFEQNKEELKETEEFESKRLRNRVAGYIVRVVDNRRE